MIRQIAPYLLFALYRLLQWSWRIEIHETDEVRSWRKSGESFVIAHWHGDELGILPLLRPYHVACIISTSQDGDLMNKAVQLLGGETVRGSSTREGAQALKGILRLKKKGRRPSVAVDGPRGPIHEVKPGVLQISRLTGLPIVPLSFATNRGFIFKKSWNKSCLPLPFARVVIQWGQAMGPLTANDNPKDSGLARELALKITGAQKLAASRL